MCSKSVLCISNRCGLIGIIQQGVSMSHEVVLVQSDALPAGSAFSLPQTRDGMRHIILVQPPVELDSNFVRNSLYGEETPPEDGMRGSVKVVQLGRTAGSSLFSIEDREKGDAFGRT